MQKEYLIFSDVSGDLDASYVQQGKLKLLPMEFIIDGKAYTFTDAADGLDLKQFYGWVKSGAEVKTTQISPDVYEAYFEEYLKAGYSVLFLCLSSGLSSTFSSACQAAENLKKRYPDCEVLPVDSLLATGGLGLLGERMIENKDKGLSIFENYEDLLACRSKIRVWASVDDMSSLVRGGRMSKGKAMVGGLLGIKPMITITPEGTLAVAYKPRGIKGLIKKYGEAYAEFADVMSCDTVYVSHADEEENSIELENRIKELNPNCVIKRRMLSPIIGAHLGPGALGMSIFKK